MIRSESEVKKVAFLLESTKRVLNATEPMELIADRNVCRTGMLHSAGRFVTFFTLILDNVPLACLHPGSQPKDELLEQPWLLEILIRLAEPVGLESCRPKIVVRPASIVERTFAQAYLGTPCSDSDPDSLPTIIPLLTNDL